MGVVCLREHEDGCCYGCCAYENLEDDERRSPLGVKPWGVEPQEHGEGQEHEGQLCHCSIL